MPPTIHPSASIDDNVHIGNNSAVWHFCHIMSGANIGEDCVLGQNVFIGENVHIGNRVKIQNNVSVYSGITIEDEVFCGPSCVFTNDSNPRSAFPKHGEYKKTLVKKGATIGANATILAGITIGEYAFIGAGSVVTKDVPPYALVYGNPAIIHGSVDEKGTIINK